MELSASAFDRYLERDRYFILFVFFFSIKYSPFYNVVLLLHKPFPDLIFPSICLLLSIYNKGTHSEDIKNLHSSFFVNQAWNIPLCWPVQFLYLRHWSLRQDADWLLSVGEQWWKYLQSNREKKKVAINTEATDTC